MNDYKNLLIFQLAFYACLIDIHAQAPKFPRPYRTAYLRLPSIPLAVNDPYFSIWSPYDKLTDGTTAHWTGSRHDEHVKLTKGVHTLVIKALDNRIVVDKIKIFLVI